MLVNNYFAYIHNCDFKGNAAATGAGIFAEASNEYLEIVSSRFDANVAKEYGGSLYFGEAHDFTVLRNVNITASQSRYGGGM